MKKKPQLAVDVELRNLAAQNKFFDELHKTPSQQIRQPYSGSEYLPQTPKVIRRTFSREEMLDYALKWAKNSSLGNVTGTYHSDLGLLVDFCTDLFDGKELK